MKFRTFTYYAGLSCMMLAAVSTTANTTLALPTVAPALQDEATATDELPKNAAEFQAILKEDPEKAQAIMEQMLETQNPMSLAAVNLMANYQMSKRDYNAACAIINTGFDHFYEIVKTSDDPTPVQINSMISTAQMFAAYSSRASEYSSKSAVPMGKAMELLLPALLESDQPTFTTPMVIRMVPTLARDSNFSATIEKLKAQTLKWRDAAPEDEEANAPYLELVATTNDENATAILSEAKDKFPESSRIFTIYFNNQMSSLNALIRENPQAASETLNRLKEELANNESLTEQVAANYDRSLTGMERSLGPALARLELIGKPAPLFDAEAWVNGEATTLKDLRGKVVLLDFWAVWCGPCIATFPHLREWHEEYGDDGLVIVGVTSQYNYTWDDDAERAVRGEEQSMDAEIAMLEKFLAHHELKHASMVNPADSNMKKEYGVSGIPQAVLIDKAGNVRMIKVGSGQANADALHEMIEELLKE